MRPTAEAAPPLSNPPSPVSDGLIDKAALRRIAGQRRADAHAVDPAERAARLADQGAGLIVHGSGLVVSGYIAMRAEIDPLPLLVRLHDAGATIALPVVVAANRPLVFRAWTPGGPLEPAAFGTRVPPATAPEVAPMVMLVPLLAFDPQCFRLGYGGGFYDRTLASARLAGRTVRAYGLAYSEQAMDSLPLEDHDVPLDAVITPDGVVWPAGAKSS